MRSIDPFAYLSGYASAIAGLGGLEPSPDPRYCLHTPYVEVRPGHAIFHLTIAQARASRGELTLRVHGYREGGDVILVTSSRLLLDGLVGARVDHELRFAALEGVQYALFAFFSEPSDLETSAVGVAIEELEESIAIRAAVTRGEPSRFAADGHAPSARLLGDDPPSFRSPVSQPRTRTQLADPLMSQAWPAIAAAPDAEPWRWEMSVALQALRRAGTLAAGAHGLVFDPPHGALRAELARAGAMADEVALAAAASAGAAAQVWVEDEGADGAFDFVLSFTALVRGAGEAVDLIGAGLRCLRGGGMGVFLLPFRSSPDALDHAPGALDRNALQAIALRLIGQSYAVAQFAFGPRDDREATSFVLIVHRPIEG